MTTFIWEDSKDKEERKSAAGLTSLDQSNNNRFGRWGSLRSSAVFGLFDLLRGRRGGGTSEAFSSPATGERSSQGQHSAGNELLEMRRKCEDSSAGMTRSWEKTCVREEPPSDAHRAQREGERPNSQFLPSLAL